MAAGIATLALAAVLAVAGVSKLIDIAGTRESLRDFGVPRGLARPLAFALPLTELALAVLLLPMATARAAAAGSFLLLLVFTGALARALAGGAEVDCHCFGRLSSKPASFWTLARNAGLMALAATLAIGGVGEAALGWIGELSATGRVATAAAVVVAVLLVVIATLLRRYGRLLVRVGELERRLSDAGIEAPSREPAAGLEPGTPAPMFELPNPAGGRVASADLIGQGRPLLLVFSAPDCAACAQLMPRLTRWQHEHAARLRIVVVSAGEDAHGLMDVLVDHDAKVAASYEVRVTPGAVLIDESGRVATHAALGEDAIAALVEPGRDRPALELVHAGGPPRAGDRAPEIVLPSVDGSTGAIEGQRLVVFWNPDCPFCARGLDELKRIGADPDLPTLLVIGRGSSAAMSALDLPGEVLVDATGDTARAYGISGTPGAVLVDSDGVVASDPALGMAALTALAEDQRLPAAGGAHG